MKKYILPVSLAAVSYGEYGFVLYTLYHAKPNRYDGNLFIFSILRISKNIFHCHLTDLRQLQSQRH